MQPYWFRLGWFGYIHFDERFKWSCYLVSTTVGGSDHNSINFTVLKHRFHLLRHLLRMSFQQLPRSALFADSETGWKKAEVVSL